MANKNIFNSIEIKGQQLNHFDLTHDVKCTGQFGDLMPICAIETVPGDKFNISSEALVRFQPMQSPVMHRFDVTTHYFFVPNRILWPNWEEFITGSKLATAGSTEHAHPTVNFSGLNDVRANRLAHLMGVPYSALSNVQVNANALPFSAYLKIYDEYYRDQNLIPAQWKPLTNGNQMGVEANALKVIRKRAWEHDYFTSSLPFAQKGETVDIPLGDIIYNNTDNTAGKFHKDIGGDAAAGSFTLDVNGVPIDTASDQLAYDPRGTLQTESTTINDLRRAFRLQEWLEKNARAGTRYVESILMHFGIKSSDARLQRPEYITGSKSPISISEVLNTTGQTGGVVQGNMAGHGVGVTNGHNGSYTCEEHGWIIGIMSVLPKPAYFQGVPRPFSKDDRFSYYWPTFANIGEQEVKNKEIYCGAAAPESTFGYVPRYAEYRYQNNRIAGEFMTTLDHWTLARKFENEPALNQAFIECSPDDRIFYVGADVADPLLINIVNKVSALRPLPKFGTPTF